MFGNNSAGVETEINRLVPKSLNVFVWRVKRRRIPVRAELDKRGIDLDSVRCPMCDDSLETIEHAMILCKFAYEIWVRVYRWWSFGNPTNLSIGEIFNGVGNNIRGEVGKEIWQVVEWVSGYVIWKYRNQKVFQNKETAIPNIVNEIQVKSYEWISRRSKKLNVEWQQWFINPSSYVNGAPSRVGIG
ncbi:uncharacterized protein [Rutidosis leptorrhynchoides]|uniref:uncharacterized protein n=1 Tax=Rutidosis leptorrhynchoides TaxID=125765 RepID=UPI003A991E1E